MVRGLDVFRGYFAGHADQFVLIGGTAATLAMEDAGLEFRATKDLDIVLHIEALNAAFGEVFWKFVEEGRYEIRQASNTGRPVFYRFQRPANERFPVMLELFCRAPDGIKLAEGSHLTPIPLDEAVASLSAILLDDEYYAFIMAGRKESDGLPWVGEDRLIPLKASAWLGPQCAPSERRGRGCQEHPQTRERRDAAVAIACAGSTHTTRGKDRRRSESFSRWPRGRSLDRSEVAQAQQYRRRNRPTHCAGLRTEARGHSMSVMTRLQNSQRPRLFLLIG